MGTDWRLTRILRALLTLASGLLGLYGASVGYIHPFAHATPLTSAFIAGIVGLAFLPLFLMFLERYHHGR